MNQASFPVHLIEADRWIIADDSSQMVASVIAQEKREANIDGTHLIGYLYVDSTAGLSLHVKSLAVMQPDGTIKLTGGAMERNVGIAIRYEDETFKRFRLLTDQEINQLGLPVEPPHMEIYRRPEVAPLRKLPYLHHLRAPGFPDDIQVLLVPATKDQRPEQVWARLQRQIEQYAFECELLNQPYQNMGIKAGDKLIARLAQVSDSIMAISEAQKKFR